MNPYVWAALGAALGWLATFGAADKAFMSKVETIGAGIFGASIGGQVQLNFTDVAAGAGFQPATLAGALAGGIAMLVVLTAFRKAVGPLKTGKKKPRGH
jgi:uncharacterized membrane protein YeaQ/YmgE (transglycosylase-associated protein family)